MTPRAPRRVLPLAPTRALALAPVAGAGHVTLVRGPMQMAAGNHVTLACPPLGLAYLAATLRAASVPVSLVDAVGAAPHEVRADGGFLRIGLSDQRIAASVSAGTSLVGVSCMFSEEWPLVRETIAAIARARPGVPVVVGGEHATALPAHVLREAPAVVACVLGEGEATLLEIVRALATGRPLSSVDGLVVRGPGDDVLTTARTSRIAGIDTIPRPAWDLVPMSGYLDHGLGYGVDRGRSVPILATRGCPYQCTFCSSPSMWTTRWSARDPSDVVDEMEAGVATYRARNFDFFDLTAVVRRDWILEFCRRIVERGLDVTWQVPAGTRSEAIDAEVARWLVRAGCRNVAYAPESGSPALLERIKKKVSLERMRRSMAEAVAAGLRVKANLVLGFPDETLAEAQETIAFCRVLAALGLDDVNITPFCPYPGSEDFDALRARGRIPALDDAYFRSLGCYSDLVATASWSDHLDARAIARLRWQGMAEFYGRALVRRPRRVVEIARSLVTGRQETRLDKAFSDLAQRHTLARGALAGLRGLARRTRLASDISARDS